MRVRFWGTRGSIAKPGPSTLRYGGNTSCIEVEADDGTLVVIDCGTGSHDLARKLLAASKPATRGHLLVSHMHWDHIQGFPFFDPLFLSDSEWDIYAPGGHGRHLQSALAGQMSYDYHPVTLDAAEGILRFHDLTEGVFQAGSIRITCQYLNHPALTLGYRLEADDGVLVYASDHEPHALPSPGPAPVAPEHLEDLRHVGFLEGADLVIHDAQYTLAEFPDRSGWGHSPAESVVDYAIAAGAGKLALHHHDPLRDDDAIDRLTELAQRRAASARSAPDVFAAREGAVIEIAAKPQRFMPPSTHQRSALLPEEPTHVATVLLIGARPEALRDIRATLEAEPIRLLQYADEAAALRDARAERPSIFIVDQGNASDHGRDVCRAVRGDPNFEDVPVLMITDSRREAADMALAFYAGASDYLVRPIKPNLLRARVRSWLLRTSPT
jgi:phosphoribosyl 1,2-cyclic phosphodiesterase/CheY-like chemotaxis protein